MGNDNKITTPQTSPQMGGMPASTGAAMPVPDASSMPGADITAAVGESAVQPAAPVITPVDTATTVGSVAPTVSTPMEPAETVAQPGNPTAVQSENTTGGTGTV